MLEDVVVDFLITTTVYNGTEEDIMLTYQVGLVLDTE